MNKTLFAHPPGSVCFVKDCKCSLPKAPALSMPNAACHSECGCSRPQRGAR